MTRLNGIVILTGLQWVISVADQIAIDTLVQGLAITLCSLLVSGVVTMRMTPRYGRFRSM